MLTGDGQGFPPFWDGGRGMSTPCFNDPETSEPTKDDGRRRPPPKRGTKSLGGFSTAMEVLNSAVRVADGPKSKNNDGSKNQSHNCNCTAKSKSGNVGAAHHGAAKQKKQKIFGGFSTAMEFMNSSNVEINAAANDLKSENRDGAAKVNEAASESKRDNDDVKANGQTITINSTEISISLIVRGICHYKENVDSLGVISAHRQPNNMYDSNAIAVHNGNEKVIGHIAREQAALLAPYLDERLISLENITVKEERDFMLIVIAKVRVLDKEKNADIQSAILALTDSGETDNFDIVNAQVADQLSSGISAQDLNTASQCPLDLSGARPLPWKTSDDGRPLVWPPSNDAMARLGFGHVDDEEWWQKKGLNPPMMWNVTGALDLLPHVQVSSHQKLLSRDILNDAIHGVTNIWTDETLNDIRSMMHSSNFWSHRGADAFIKAYGGPYVLGQQEGKLNLIIGNPHNAITERICHGHNIVYTIVHSAPPVGPGFNTLIFGLNLKRSGFHYHQDAIGALKAKNAPLLPRQPVVTTVYYEKPQQDGGKEMVLWKPLMNFKPKDNSVYAAARGIVTSHGMVHVQRAGLQSKALHGIFRNPMFSSNDDESTPSLDPRMGYRVAITARITYEDSEERLEPFLKGDHYTKVLGPVGDKTLKL